MTAYTMDVTTTPTIIQTSATSETSDVSHAEQLLHSHAVIGVSAADMAFASAIWQICPI
jgi:hypothetical protein